MESKIQKQLIIFNDDREQNYEIIKELQKLDIICEQKRLNIGDYLFFSNNNKILIEMKSVDDFCMSIIDGRMKRQAQKLEESDGETFIMVYGKISDRKTLLEENCIVGMIISLTLKYKSKIIWLDNERQIAFAMKRIFERISKDEK